MDKSLSSSFHFRDDETENVRECENLNHQRKYTCSLFTDLGVMVIPTQAHQASGCDGSHYEGDCGVL